MGFKVSARRRARSQNFFAKNTLDNLSTSLSYTNSFSRSSQIDSSRRIAWSGDASYNLTFGSKNYVEPFKWVGQAPLLGKLTNTKLYYSPQSLSLQLQATKSKDFSETRLAGSRKGVVSNTSVYTAVTNFRTAMKLVENINLDFSYGFTSDLLSRRRAETLAFQAFEDSVRLVRRGDLTIAQFDTLKPKPIIQSKQGLTTLLSGEHEVVSLAQAFGVKYSPNLFRWFNPNLSYGSNYRYSNNIQQGTVGRSAGTTKTFTASSTLRFADLFQIFKRKESPRGRETPERQRPAPRLPPGQQEQPQDEPDEGEVERQEPPRNLDDENREPPQEKENKDKDAKKQKEESKSKEDKPGRGISPLQFFSLFTKFKDVSINFSRNDSYSDNALNDGTPSWRYRLGFTRNPGVRQLYEKVAAPSAFQRRDNLSLSSGLDVSRSFNITVRFDHDQQRSESRSTAITADKKKIETATITGSSSDSWLRTSELGLSFLPDADIPFPEWTVTWSGLERIKLFGKFATSMSLSHGFGGKKSTVWNGSPERITSEDFSFNFRPLIKVNATLKNGMVTSFQYSKTTGERPTYSFNSGLNKLDTLSAALSRNNEMSFTLTYSKQSGFKIPLPFLKNKELRNSIDLSVTYLRSSSESGLRRGTADDISANSTKRWSFSPRMTYSFSNRVRGGAHFEIGKTESKLSGDTNIKELGIDINISIRGE
jgi:hypothetical protein